MSRELKRIRTSNDRYISKRHRYEDSESDTDEQSKNPLDILTILSLLNNKPQSSKVYRMNNHIYFKTEVTNGSINTLQSLINEYNSECDDELERDEDYNPKPLYLHITTIGGDAFASLLAFDLIKLSKIPIYTVIEGYVASGGTIMSMAGDKRFMTSNSFMLAHELRSGVQGKYSRLKEEFGNDTILMNKLLDIYCNNSRVKLVRRDLREELSHDKLWSLTDAIARGFIDAEYRGEIE